MKGSKLTEAQRLVLDHALRLRPACTVYPRRGQYQIYRTLVGKGLLREVGVGIATGDAERRFRNLYVITIEGRSALAGAA